MSFPPRFSREFLDSLRQKHPLSRVAERLGFVVENGRMKCIHPERHSHGDKTPSLTLDDGRGWFKCWVCPDIRGDVFTFIQKVRGCTFTEAVEWLAEGALPQWAPQTPKQHSQALEFGHSHKPIAHENWSEHLSELRRLIVVSFLRKCDEVGGAQGDWLKQRGIPPEVWKRQKLRRVVHYGRISEEMLREFSLEQLERVGLFNSSGHLRFFKHSLIFPYLDQSGHAVYFQARAIDPDVTPKELNLRGPFPCPYNAPRLDGEPGVVYLCEGVVDALTLLVSRPDYGETVVAIPGVHGFKKEWVPWFKNKKVWLALDHDAPGHAAMHQLFELFHQHHIEVNVVPIPEGMDINDWIGRKKNTH